MQGLLDEWSKRLPATPTGPVFSELRQTLDGNSVQ